MARRFQSGRAIARWTLAACLFGGLATAGCKKDAPAATDETSPAEPTEPKKYGLTEAQAKQVLATVGDTTITLGQFAERLGSQSPYLRARYTSPERRREFLDNMIRFELLAIEARRRGHDQHEDIARVRRQVMVQQMMKEMFDEQGVKLGDITDQEISAYYDSHRDEFSKPAQMRASQIQVATREKAEQILAKVKGAPDDMQAFRQLATEHNTDPASKDSQGDLRFFAKTPGPNEADVPQPVRDAAFALGEIGDVAPQVVASDRGFHVVKLTGKREAMERTLEDVRRMIQNRLWREKREKAIEAFVADLRAKANVQEDRALLSQIEIDLDAPAPATDEDGADGWKPPTPAPAAPAAPAKTAPATPAATKTEAK
jgi:peptidyl-prolyl cis-trans isomerase C